MGEAQEAIKELNENLNTYKEQLESRVDEHGDKIEGFDEELEAKDEKMQELEGKVSESMKKVDELALENQRPSTPEGSVEEPLNPLMLLLSSGASFVSRGYAGKIDHLADLIVEAVEHEGFSLVDVLQPCVVFHNDQYEKYNEAVEMMEEPAETRYEAMELTEETERLPIGVFYKEDQPVYHQELYPDSNVVKDKIGQEEREKRVEKILEERM